MFWIDSRLEFKWFFLRSSFHPENVSLGDLENENSQNGMGIADVTSSFVDAERRGRGSFVMFSTPPIVRKPTKPSNETPPRRWLPKVWPRETERKTPSIEMETISAEFRETRVDI